MQRNVAIFDGEDPSCLPFLQYYCIKKHTIFLLSSHRFPISLFSKFHSFLHINHPPTGYLLSNGRSFLSDQMKMQSFIMFVKSIFEKKNIEEFLFFTESTLVPFLLHLKYLDRRNIYVPLKIFSFLHNKKKLFLLMKKYSPESFLLPKTYSYSNTRFPCIVRPTIGVGSFYVYICNNREELKRALSIIQRAQRKPLIQEYIKPKEKFAINLLVDRKQRIVRAVSTLKIERGYLLRIIRELERVFKEIGYYGFASPQFIVSEEGKAYLTEINPRLSFYYFGLDFGANFPEAFHEAIVERKRVKKKFVFLKRLPPFYIASLIYLNKMSDTLPVIKSYLDYLKGKIAFILQQKYNNL